MTVLPVEPSFKVSVKQRVGWQNLTYKTIIIFIKWSKIQNIK